MAEIKERERLTFEQLRERRIERAIEAVLTAKEGLTWSLDTMTEMTDTLQEGDLIVGLAYSGAGKTTFGQDQCDHFALQGHSVMYFGTEQKDYQLTMKQGCKLKGIPIRDARRGRLTAYWRDQLVAQIRAMADGPLSRVHFYPEPSPTPGQVIAAIRRAVAEQGVKVVVYDYLGRTTLPGKNETLEMKQFVRDLKNLALELKIVIIALQQINTPPETGVLAKHVPPSAADVRGGMAVIHEADFAFALFQPLRQGVTDDDKKAVRMGMKQIGEIVEPDTCAIIKLKEREGGGSSRKISTCLCWVHNNKFYVRDPKDREIPRHIRFNEYYAFPDGPQGAPADGSRPAVVVDATADRMIAEGIPAWAARGGWSRHQVRERVLRAVADRWAEATAGLLDGEESALDADGVFAELLDATVSLELSYADAWRQVWGYVVRMSLDEHEAERWMRDALKRAAA